MIRKSCPYCARVFYEISDYRHHLKVIHEIEVNAKNIRYNTD